MVEKYPGVLLTADHLGRLPLHQFFEYVFQTFGEINIQNMQSTICCMIEKVPEVLSKTGSNGMYPLFNVFMDDIL